MITYLWFRILTGEGCSQPGADSNLRQQIAVLQIDDDDETDEVPEADDEEDDTPGD